MKIATPQSLPDGESSSAGMSVSTAATMNAASVAVSVQTARCQLRAEPPRPARPRPAVAALAPRSPPQSRCWRGLRQARIFGAAAHRLSCKPPALPSDRMRAACVGFGKSPMQLSRPGYLSRAGGEEDRSAASAPPRVALPPRLFCLFRARDGTRAPRAVLQSFPRPR